ncbi:MAG TPA: shikimate dehydrogenase, partial [Alphaproteobacteria bacterium]|nr:shikimate dehydrogenase [Alphaproteobacteria bacterium]
VVRGLNGLKNFGGLAVTIPHKLALAELCDELGDGARATGAVNAVRFDDDGKIYGNNFDGEGFVAGLIGEGYQLQGKRVLLLGAGGAARAVAVAVAHHGCAHIDIANRTLQKAAATAELTGKFTSKSSVGTTTLETADLGAYDIVINATSVGLHDDDPHPVPIDSLASDCLVCDIIMVPDRTNWLIAAEDSGRPVHKGRHMLDYQLELIGRFIGAFD